MSIASEISRISGNISSAYSKLQEKGAALPQSQNSMNLASTIESVNTKEDIEWHQCTEAVRTYLQKAAQTYPSDTGYTTSVIRDAGCAPSTPNIADTKPVGKTIEGVTFRDNVPGVAEAFATTNHAGTITFVDRLRWINTTYDAPQGVAYPRGTNTRDVGGWSCGTGRDGNPCAVKYGMLFRGSEPNAADRALMVEKLGIKSELQLLPTSEQSSDRLLKSVWGVDWYGNDTANSSVYGIDSTEVNRYLWKKYFSAVFESTAKGKPVYIHCGIGADRTGSVMIMLEAILGMPESEIAQDYELTNFAFNNEPTTVRRRTTDAYKAYMNAIKNVSLVGGLADTFTNRAISFALSLGFTAAQINDFRNACTDGEPVQITLSSPVSYTVTKTGSNVNFDNSANSVDQFQDYAAKLTPAAGYVITGVSVTMGGTALNAFEGVKENLYRRVTNTLSHCTTDSNRISVIDGQCYVSQITADSGYTLTGATVSITIGGVEMAQQYYSEGRISIPNVTGNIVITVTAVQQGPSYTNLADKTGGDWLTGKRISSSSGAIGNNAGVTDLTNCITVAAGDIVRMKGVMGSTSNYNTWKNGSAYAAVFASTSATSGTVFSMTTTSYDSTNDILSVTIPSGTSGLARFIITLAWASNDIIITRNEEIV